jgi:hypothetical protein
MRAVKVLMEDNNPSQLSTDYHSEIQILTGYLFKVIFIEKSGMRESSYGGSNSTIEIQ